MFRARRRLYREIEAHRKSRVIAYVTSDRAGMGAQIASDAVDLFSSHLDRLFPAPKISFLVYTTGGDTLAAWNIVNMLRMFCDELEIIVPSRARSAGTLMCLGAERVIMTKQATLGPIDPSLNGPLNPQIPGGAPGARVPVSVEVVRGYIEMAKQDFGVKGADMAAVLIDLASRVHPLVLGSIFRSRSQIQTLAAQLLKSQVKDTGKQKKIINFLCSESGSHDYTINRREARQLGLNIENPTQDLYEVLKGWMDNIASELELGSPFDPNRILGVNQQANYSCVRCLIESTAPVSAKIFVSEGELTRTQIVHPQMGPQPAINDNRTFEGWRNR